MVVKVWGIIAAYAQDTAALGRPGFCPLECRRGIPRPSGQRGAGSEAGFQQIAAAYALDRLGMSLRWLHREPSRWWIHFLPLARQAGCATRLARRHARYPRALP